MAVPIDVLGCTHGNEKLGLVLGRYIRDEPAPGVRYRTAHPKATKQGVRYIGTGAQLQDHYPGNRHGNPEDRAAYRNMKWLGRHVSSTGALIYDVHNCDVMNLTAFSVGKRALASTMVGAWLLGYDKCYLHDDSFRSEVSNAALLENGVREEEFGLVAKQLHRNLGDLALASAPELAARYGEMVANVRFYAKHEICTTAEDGTVRPIIPSLEAVPSSGGFGQLDLSRKQREALNIPQGVEVLAESWGHDNMSKVVPSLGETADGVPRRAWFGAYFLEVEPPVLSGQWALHEGPPGI